MPVIVVPAVDIRGGKVVRLKHGELQEEKVYGSDPVEVARRWEAEGATRLHLVDLDAAISSQPQFDTLAEIIDAVAIPVEVGGGLRVLENAMRYRQRGADRVIFGTAAIAAPGVVQEAVRLWPEAVAVAIDARDGKVKVAGWNEITEVEAVDLAAQMEAWAVKRIQYTDVVRDGGSVGPNLPAIEGLARSCALRVTVAGGLSSLDDVRRVRALEDLGVDEAVVGKALYEKRFTLAEAMEAAR
jgi:phosphoribosylformimino-5-aminoimidazole carboxamide ribotide isomerase